MKGTRLVLCLIYECVTCRCELYSNVKSSAIVVIAVFYVRVTVVFAYTRKVRDLPVWCEAKEQIISV
jgi:hypothetical protein